MSNSHFFETYLRIFFITWYLICISLDIIRDVMDV